MAETVTIYEPGETFGTISEDGAAQLWTVTEAGTPVPSSEWRKAL